MGNTNRRFVRNDRSGYLIHPILETVILSSVENNPPCVDTTPVEEINDELSERRLPMWEYWRHGVQKPLTEKEKAQNRPFS